MKQRLITAFIGIAYGITVMFLAKTVLYPITVALIAAVSVHELLSVTGCSKFRMHYIGCLIFSAVLPFMAYYGLDYIWRYLFSTLAAFLMFGGYVADHKKLPFEKLAVMISCTTLVTLSITCLVSFRNISEVHGICYVVMGLMAAWIPDAGAYFVGTFCGKHKLCPEISPKKTIEGAVGGVVVAAVVFAIYGFCYQQVMHAKGIDFSVNYLLIVIMAVISSVISMVGDLTASLLKRENNVKDFGNLMPGHGGMVDRFDSVYFVLPFLLLFYSYCNIYV